jgi:methylphosphotriester-DNA--protein-cysteine methyltransferase
VSVIGVRFRPCAARAFLGVEADTATDKRLDLAALHHDAPARLLRALGLETREERRFELVCDYVEARLSGAAIDAEVKAVSDAVLAGEDAERPDHIAERHWQRRFKAAIGVSPRMLQSIARFRRVFDAIERPETAGWVEAALAAGYFDQPQMARDFRRFLGVTAREWAQQKAGLATALAASGSYKTAGEGPG